MNEPRRESRFHVSLHDVVPCWRQEIEAILAQLRQRLGSTFSLAVVPAWRGTPLDAINDRMFLATIRKNEAELLLHGYTHQTHKNNPLGWLTGKQNELGGCSVEEASARLLRGRELLERLLEKPVVGAVPPAWDHGPMDIEKLHTIGIPRQVGLFSLRSARRSMGLATSSWDTDRAGLFAPLGEASGRLLARTFPSLLPQIVLHPLDLRRGWLKRGLALIDLLLSRGQVPTRIEDLLPNHTISR